MKRKKFPSTNDNGDNGLKRFAAYDDSGPPQLNQPLDPREAVFVANYVLHFDGPQAVKDSGMVSQNNTRKAREISDELLYREDVQQAIAQAVDDRVKRTLITGDMIINEFAKIAFASIDDIYDDNGNLRSIKDMPKHVRAAINYIEHNTIWAGKGSNKVKTGYVSKIRLYDKQTALTSLWKMIHGADMNSNVNFYQDNRQYQYNDYRKQRLNVNNLDPEEIEVLRKMMGTEESEDARDEFKELEEWARSQ